MPKFRHFLPGVLALARREENPTMVRIPTHRAPTHPGEMLSEEFLKPLGMTQTELAQRIGVSYPRVNELVHGKRGVTPDTALRLERLFGVEAQFWLNLQLAWDLYHAMHAPEAKAIRAIKPLPLEAAPDSDTAPQEGASVASASLT